MALLDVREDLKRGRPPIKRITEAAAQLAPGESLVLVTPFEPIPMIGAMRGNGFAHKSRQIAAAYWETVFTPDSGAPEAQEETVLYGAPTVDVDARGLEPPEPMVKILSALNELREGCVLRALTDRRPLHLLDAIAERGFRSESFEEKPNGSWITLIRHA